MGVKVNRGGRYTVTTQPYGYYGNDIAGQKHELVPKEWGTKREFVGAGTEEFVFYDRVHGTLIVTARNFQEAWRVARMRGYSRRSYKKR